MLRCWAVIALAQVCVCVASSYYELLQLDPATATPSDARRQFRKLSVRLHPDKNAAANSPNGRAAFEQLQQVPGWLTTCCCPSSVALPWLCTARHPALFRPQIGSAAMIRSSYTIYTANGRNWTTTPGGISIHLNTHKSSSSGYDCLRFRSSAIIQLQWI